MAVVRLTNANLAELKEAFMLFDYDKDGKVFSRDIPVVVRSVGLKPAQQEVKAMQQEVDSKGGMCDLQTLVTLISQTVTSPGQDQPQDMLEMFRIYDPEGRGVISEKDMRHVLTTIGEKLTDEEVDTLYRLSGCVDSNRGAINYQKFVQKVLQG